MDNADIIRFGTVRQIHLLVCLVRFRSYEPEHVFPSQSDENCVHNTIFNLESGTKRSFGFDLTFDFRSKFAHKMCY